MADAKGNAFATAIITGILTGTSVAGVFDNDGTSPITALSVQLHTGSPGNAGNLATNEAAYTGYERVSVPRATSSWTVTTAAVATPTTTISFPQCAGGSESITYFSIGNSTVAASTGQMFYYGPVNPSLAVSAGVTPRLSTLTQIIEM